MDQLTMARTTRPGPSADTGTPFRRLAALEARKQVDTRAGQILLFGGAALILVVYVTGVLFAGQAPSFMDAISIGVVPLGLLLPILAILGVTTEWSHGGAQISFVLEPRRLRVLAAKVVGSLLLAGALVGLALVAAAIATLLGGLVHGAAPTWTISAWPVTGLIVLLGISTLQGAAFGAALQNTAASIVAFLAFPTIASVLIGVIPALEPAVPWVDINVAMSPLMAEQISPVQVVQLVSTSVLWIGGPLLIGAHRFLHREPTGG